MNIRWLNWKELLEEAGILRNLDADLNQIERPELRRIAQAVNLAVDYAWKFHPWACACWIMRQLDNGADTPVPLLENNFGVLRCYAEDPLAAWDAERNATILPVRLNQGTVTARPGSATETWYAIRTAAPRFGGETRDNARQYRPGELVYDATTGECWRAVFTHTGTALPSWSEWQAGEAIESSGTLRRRNGVLYSSAAGMDTGSTNEPGYGSGWEAVWSAIPRNWTPMRLPYFLLPAVLAGARSWMESTSSGAMQEAMIPALETEVSDFGTVQGQFGGNGQSIVVP